MLATSANAQVWGMFYRVETGEADASPGYFTSFLVFRCSHLGNVIELSTHQLLWKMTPSLSQASEFRNSNVTPAFRAVPRSCFVWVLESASFILGPAAIRGDNFHWHHMLL